MSVLHTSMLALFKPRNGERAAFSDKGTRKLTAEKVIEMRQRYAAGETTNQLGKAYGVTRYAAGLAVSGETWGHIPGAVEIRDPNAKTDPETIEECRRLRAEGKKHQEIADIVGVGRSTVSRHLRPKLEEVFGPVKGDVKRRRT